MFGYLVNYAYNNSSMNPNNPQSSLDYLNQISTPAPIKKPFFINKFILIGLIAAILIIILIIIVNVLSGGSKPVERLAARLNATDAILNDATPKVQSSQLRTYNSNLKIYLTNTIRDIAPILTKQKIDIKKLSTTVTNSENTTETLAILENARLNVVYDRTYAREMSYKLSTVLTLMRQIFETTNDDSLKTFLENAYTNLEPTQKQFADFNTANS